MWCARACVCALLCEGASDWKGRQAVGAASGVPDNGPFVCYSPHSSPAAGGVLAPLSVRLRGDAEHHEMTSSFVNKVRGRVWGRAVDRRRERRWTASRRPPAASCPRPRHPPNDRCRSSRSPCRTRDASTRSRTAARGATSCPCATPRTCTARPAAQSEWRSGSLGRSLVVVVGGQELVVVGSRCCRVSCARSAGSVRVCRPWLKRYGMRRCTAPS